MSGSTDFDPDDTRAQPLRIREQAQGFARVGGQLTGQRDSLPFVLNSLASSFSEVLHPVIGDQIGAQFYTLQEVVGALLYAEQVTGGWAQDVVVFQQHRDDLIQRWESASANGFWVTRAPGYDNVEPEMRDTLYDDARHRVLTELNTEADAAYTAFTLAAQDRGRQLREGPTVANLLGLLSDGPAGGPGMAILYPYLPVTGPRYGLPRAYWGMTPEQLIRAPEDDAELGALLVSRRPDLMSPDPFEAALALAAMMLRGDTSGAAYGAASAERVAEVAEILAGIPAQEMALLAALFPAVVGNLNGMPFEHRIAANRIRVADALHQARAERCEPAAAAAEAAAEAAQRAPETPGYEGGFQADAVAAQQRLADLDTRIGQFELLLTEPTVDYGNAEGPPWPDYRGRKILYFDPRGDGSWAELIGTITPETDDIGIFVPGVGTDTPDMSKQSDTATGFVEQAARDGTKLAMIVWAGGDFPDGVPSALTDGYAEDLVGPLVDFSYAVQQEIDDQRPPAGVPVTVIGHSYGGLAVAMSATSGLSADNLLFVNSPGTGDGPLEVMNALEDYENFAMVVPWDVVPYGGPLAHGLPPTAIDSVVVLDTGGYVDGTEISGPSGHSGVFAPNSTAWENILAVLTGRPVLVD